MSNNTLTNKELRFSAPPSQKIISSRAYNLIIGATLLYGFAVNAVMISLFEGAFDGINLWVLLIGYIVCIFIGVSLTRSESPVVSFIGYNFVVVPIGVLLTILLPNYSSDLVFDAVVITGIITLVMMVAGTMFPAIFFKIGRALFFTLVAVVIVEAIGVFLLGKDYAIIDYIVVLIFSGYVGYDWARANAYQKTANNAIDSATDLYMDIINIFVRILSILNRNS